MPDRLDMKPEQTIVQHTLEKAHAAILAACFTEDGLDSEEGASVLELIVDALGYDPGPKECGACQLPFDKCKGH